MVTNRKRRLPRLGPDVPARVIELDPMMCAECDFRFLSPESLALDKCPLCQSHMRTRWKAYQHVKNTEHLSGRRPT